MSRLPLSLVLVPLIAGCASRPAVVAEVAPPPPAPPPVSIAMPAGGVAGMAIPARTADGNWPTPGRGLSADGTVWHLRAALNVAALSCRGAESATIVPAYNALLSSHRAALAGAEARYAAEWKLQAPADWRDRYDDAMTRAYNFYGQSFARPGFCAAAASALAEVATIPDDRLASFAAEQLPMIEQPFADFFTAYVAWRDQSAPVLAVSTPVRAAASAVAPPAAAIIGATQVAVAVPVAKPWLRVDPALYALP